MNPVTKINDSVKSGLAKLLANENITVQTNPYTRAAVFDTKKRVLTLPVWKDTTEDVYNMLLGRETSRAINTPTDTSQAITFLSKKFSAPEKDIKGFLNIVEDIRIEKLQKRKYPGLRKNFLNGYKNVFDAGFFGCGKDDVNNLPFIDRLNLAYKIGPNLDVEFSDREKDLMSYVDTMESFDDTVDVTRRIFDYAQNEEGKSDRPEEKSGQGDGESGESGQKSNENNTDTESNSSQNGNDQGSDGDGDSENNSDGNSEDGSESGGESEDNGSNSESENSNSNQNGNGNSGAKSEEDSSEGNGQGKTSDSKMNKSQKTTKSNGKSGGNGSGGNIEGYPDPTKATTDIAWNKAMENLINKNASDVIVYAKIPNVTNDDVKRMVDDYKVVYNERSKIFDNSYHVKEHDEFSLNFRMKEKPIISYMVNEFEQKKAAETYRRQTISKTGEINPGKLFSYKFNDDVFKRNTIVKEGKNHGFVIFVDWSGSMDSNLKKTISQLASITMFCKSLNVPFEVYTFKSGGGSNFLDKSEGTIYWSSGVKLRNILSSRMKTQEYNKSLTMLFSSTISPYVKYYCDELGSTPLDPCIILAEEIINRFKAESKVEIVNTIFLTDGGSDSMSGIYGKNYGYNKKIVVQDHKTKNEYKTNGVYLTSTLLKILKDRTGCNLVGFYIRDNIDGLESLDPTLKTRYKGKNLGTVFKTEGYVVLTQSGYDEYYVINPDMMTLLSNGQINSEETFATVVNNKKRRRTMLRNFVDRIAA